MKVLGKKWDTEEIDASTTSKQDNGYPSPFHNKDTQTEIIMTERMDMTQLFSNNQ